MAKNLVAAGAADRLQIQVAYAIGTSHPVSLAVDTFGTEQLDPTAIVDTVWEAFDFRPAAIIRDLDLRRPIYEDTAAYGHFGRTSEMKVPDANGSKPVRFFPWELADRVEELKSAVGA